ncbi:hypothetical protein [Pendulispora albinea]|uniref:Uncharacterized protein n=1 Tax=Pendulispora albinea TaxID=2741071 RepID=A0ABZ2MAW8_9BACT
MTSAFQQRADEGQILYVDDGLAVAQLGRLCVVIWRGDVTHARFERQKAGLAHIARSQPEGVGFLCIIEPSAKPPDETLRRASIEMVVGQGNHLRCTAAVIEGEGFKAAITRSVLSGMLLLFSRKVEAAFFSDVTSALKWMRNYVAVGPSEKILAFTEDVRSQLDLAKKMQPRLT